MYSTMFRIVPDGYHRVLHWKSWVLLRKISSQVKSNNFLDMQTRPPLFGVVLNPEPGLAIGSLRSVEKTCFRWSLVFLIGIHDL